MIFSYFKEKNLTLKRFIFFTLTVCLPALLLRAQDFSNIEFIENKGQWDKQVKYKGDVNAGAIFIRQGGFTILQHNPQDLQTIQRMLHQDEAGEAAKASSRVLRSHAWNVDFIGANPAMEIIPDKALATQNNYFIGNDPSKWGEGCRVFQAITLKNVYPNIDVRYYTNNGVLKYDILVKPGGNPNRIALKYQGVDKLQVKNKELVISTSVGERKESSPYTYQLAGKDKQDIVCKYVVRDNIVSFDVRGFDPTATLVIDPSMDFCSFSGSTVDNWGYTATYDGQGYMYGGGIVFGNGFPYSTGAYQTSYQGGSGSDEAVDVGIIKLSPDGKFRIYATYLGGSGNEHPHSLIVDPAGNLVIAGRTNSPNFPVTGGSLGVIGSGGGYDIFVTKLNAGGTSLVGSKRIGGAADDGVNINTGRAGVNSLQRNYGDEGRSEVILDGAGNIYVASSTQSGSSNAGQRFPVTPGAFQTTFGGGTQDAVLLKFDANVSNPPLFASFLGGSGNDAGYVLAIGPGNNIYVAGGTESSNASFLPGTQGGTVGTNLSGAIDGYIAEISNNGSTVIKSAYIGTSGIDQIYGIQFDRKGFPYVMGQTTGDFPVRNATYSNPGAKQFIAKLQPDLSSYIYSTVFGAPASLPNISPTAFLVDRCENVYVSGWGGPVIPNQPSFYPNGGTSGMPITADALDPTTDGSDFYFFVLKRDATSQLYGSYFGQTGGFADHVDGGTSRFDQNGVIYQGVCANCSGGASFPTTIGVWAATKPSSANCNLGMVKISMNLSGVGGSVLSTINGVPRDSAGCVPLTVDFSDQIRNAQSYVWNFGDGTPQIGPLQAPAGASQSHTFTAVGTYRVMLIAIDSTTCNIRDTSYISIRVGDLEATLDFDAIKIGACQSFQYQFNNLSQAPPVRPLTDTSFLWNFGDGSAPVVGGLNPVTHTFPAPGTYNVVLTLTDTAYCNAPDSDTLQLSVASSVRADFDTPPTGCVPYTIGLDNTSVAGQTWEWDFGDGNTSTAFEPSHVYNAAGTYTIRLIAINPNTCNGRDTAFATITVFDNPVADFSFTPTTPVENTPHIFNNLSSPDAVRFKWEFGDGDSLLTTSRAPVQHQYNSTGTFNACLVAYNVAGCPDTACQQVTTLVVPVVDVPNAFTPQSGDVNSKIMVRGFGISKMRFIIWNRWGQKVFETGNRLEGWDGKVKGQVQPMDVYAYTLDVEFFDGTKTTKKGDITLIR
jgi:gliding motility-associated-like protein